MTLFKTNNDVLAKAGKLERFGSALNFELQYLDGYENYEGIFTPMMGYHNGSPDDVDRGKVGFALLSPIHVHLRLLW